MMQLHLFEDCFANGQEVAFDHASARAIYVTAGEVSYDGTTYAYDAGFVAAGPITLKAGAQGASLWRWDLGAHQPTTSLQYSAKKLSGDVPAHLSKTGNFLRLDSVSFPPAGTAMLHTHQGPGIRCLREGSIRVDTNGKSMSFGPGGAWFESGPLPVFAQADHAMQSRFIRAMVLPDELRGKSSIHYVNDEDLGKPKAQSYRNFGEIGLSL